MNTKFEKYLGKAGALLALLVLAGVIGGMFYKPSQAQVATYTFRIYPVTALPAYCLPANGSVVALVSGAGSVGIYSCEAANKWVPIGTVSNQFMMNQGVLTVSTPFISHTATWNNAAVNFVDDFRNISTTAAGAGSYITEVQVNSVDLWTVSSTAMQTPGTIDLGPVASGYPAITRSAAVGGESQGIIIGNANGNPYYFAALGAATNGSMVYCANCTIANPCATGGTGAIAKRLNGVWVCN
jgi:hypothetical protein